MLDLDPYFFCFDWEMKQILLQYFLILLHKCIIIFEIATQALSSVTRFVLKRMAQ